MRSPAGASRILQSSRAHRSHVPRTNGMIICNVLFTPAECFHGEYCERDPRPVVNWVCCCELCPRAREWLAQRVPPEGAD